ncbi:MAG: hypothetical protein RL385_5640, partial [Pseudomonadota bacterium]
MRNDKARTILNAAGQSAVSRTPAPNAAQPWEAQQGYAGEDESEEVDWEELRARASLAAEQSSPRASDVAPRGQYYAAQQQRDSSEIDAHYEEELEEVWPTPGEGESTDGTLWDQAHDEQAWAAQQQQAQYEAWLAEQQAQLQYTQQQQQSEHDEWAMYQQQAQQQAEHDAWAAQQQQADLQAQQQVEYDEWAAHQQQAEQQAGWEQQQAWGQQQQAEYFQEQPAEQWTAPQPSQQPAWDDAPAAKTPKGRNKTLFVVAAGGIMAGALAFAGMRMGVIRPEVLSFGGAPAVAAIPAIASATSVDTTPVVPSAAPTAADLAARAAARSAGTAFPSTGADVAA